MKIITLNIWGGRIKDSFNHFFEQYKKTDVWMFQEVYNTDKTPEPARVTPYRPDFQLYTTIKGFLSDHQGYFVQTVLNEYGISGFLNKDAKVIEYGEHLLARGNWNHPGCESDLDRDHNRKLQWFEVIVNGKICLFVNVHLTHRPKGKGDSEKRLAQSKMIVDFLNLFNCPKILVGDFNLLPNTESIRAIESAGMRNLVKEYSITSTRTDLYDEKSKWSFSDYIFVSQEIKITEFKVLPDVISDHSPLYLDFEL